MAAKRSRTHKRHQGHPATRPTSASRPYSGPRLTGVPVYDGVVVRVVEGESHGQRDDRVVIGVGPEDEVPVAYLMLCPCDGVRGLVRELEQVAAVAAEHHPTHV